MISSNLSISYCERCDKPHFVPIDIKKTKEKEIITIKYSLATSVDFYT